MLLIYWGIKVYGNNRKWNLENISGRSCLYEYDLGTLYYVWGFSYDYEI